MRVDFRCKGERNGELLVDYKVRFPDNEQDITKYVTEFKQELTKLGYKEIDIKYQIVEDPFEFWL